MHLVALGGLAALAVLTSGALASSELDPVGVWNRDDGLGGVRVTHCGGALCGHIVWLRDLDRAAYVGEKVLYGMRRSGPATWSGFAVNPSDGRTYVGTLTLEGAHMITRGCAFGGLICQSVGLSRGR